MKTTKFFIALLALMITFSACNNRTGMSVTKRHYNKGYYIAHGSSPKKVSEKSIAATEKKKTNAAKVNQQPSVAPESPVAYPELLTASTQPSAPAASKNNVLKQKNPISYFAASSPVQNTVKRIPTRLKKSLGLKSTAPVATSDDALSLLWIVILALLILWAIAFLTGGWGLGGAVHILLVVALVLLVLWLLKVI